MLSKFNHGVEIFQIDGEGEWISKDFQLLLQNEGLVHQTTATYTLEQNGAAERYRRTVMESASCMLDAMSVPLFLWAKTIYHANYVLNRTFTKVKDVTS